MSKGSKAVCMRLPEPYWGKVEAEARARGISPADFCRRIIVESIQPVEGERVIGQVAPIPTTSTSVYPGGSPSIVTPTPSPVLLSQRAVANIEAAAAAEVLAKVEAQFPQLSQPTETMVLAGKGLAWIAENRPELFDRWIEERIANGMSGSELVEFFRLLAIHGGEQGPAATRTERKIH